MSVCYIKHSCQIQTAATTYAKRSANGKTFWREKKVAFPKLKSQQRDLSWVVRLCGRCERNHVYRDMTSCVFLPADLL